MNVTDKRAILEDMNDDTALTLVPVMVYCGVLMLLGTTGNLMVVFFYGFKSKTTSATCFILALALFDLIACVFGIPIEITDLRYYYLFESIPACRLLVFVNHFAVIASAFTLCSIAVDRYKRICKPFDKQMSVKKSKVICAICAGLGVFLGWPSVALYTVEKVDINTTYQGETIFLTGYDCTSIKEEAYKPYALVFSGIQFVGFIGITLSLIISYFLVGKQLYKHKKFRFYVAQKSLRRTASGNMTTMTSNTDYSSDPALPSVPITSIPEEDEDEYDEVVYEGPDDDPPMMQESIPDLRDLLELDARDLPEVDSDSRPSSALKEFLADRPYSGHLSRPSSILTDLSGRSKGSIMTVRSVTICDVSENQIYNIEPRDNTFTSWRPKSAMSDSTWSNSITRPGSVNSINSLSRQSSSMSIHSLTETKENSNNVQAKNSITTSHFISTNIDTTRTPRLKRTRSDGCVETGTLKRNNSSNSGKAKIITGLRRTASEGSGLKRSNSNGSATSRKGSLRRTGSTDSSKMDTDTDNLKDMRMKMLDINTIKYTVIMIVIAFVFILSCVPYLALAIWRAYSDENMVYGFTVSELVWFQIGIRSYFLNCAINPFIYGFFNSQFRAFFYNALCSCCTCADHVGEMGDIHSDSKPNSPRSYENK